MLIEKRSSNIKFNIWNRVSNYFIVCLNQRVYCVLNLEVPDVSRGDVFSFLIKHLRGRSDHRHLIYTSSPIHSLTHQLEIV